MREQKQKRGHLGQMYTTTLEGQTIQFKQETDSGRVTTKNNTSTVHQKIQTANYHTIQKFPPNRDLNRHLCTRFIEASFTKTTGEDNSNAH